MAAAVRRRPACSLHGHFKLYFISLRGGENSPRSIVAATCPGYDTEFTDEQTDTLIRELRNIIQNDRYPFTPHSDTEGDPGHAAAGAPTPAGVAPAAVLRAADQRAIPQMAMKSRTLNRRTRIGIGGASCADPNPLLQMQAGFPTYGRDARCPFPPFRSDRGAQIVHRV